MSYYLVLAEMGGETWGASPPSLGDAELYMEYCISHGAETVELCQIDKWGRSIPSGPHRIFYRNPPKRSRR